MPPLVKVFEIREMAVGAKGKEDGHGQQMVISVTIAQAGIAALHGIIYVFFKRHV